MQFTLSRYQTQKLELKYRQIHSQVAATIANRILVVFVIVDLGNASKVAEFYQLDESTVHTQHNSMLAYGWIEKGFVAELNTNSDRQRLNINGTFNIDNFSVVIDTDKTINGDSIKCLMYEIKKKNPEAEK
ncbi:MAG: hypothetical protein LBC74_15685 [Planctomycetaceae bacterium]|jgi:hypothetical protein|nr:hypothetical protein [Planctomycetaceae bacterium]